MKRHLTQLCTALIYDLSLRGFAEVSIYRGERKGLCVPGLNYYSHPGVTGSRPLGTLQNSLATMDRKLPFYILGTLLLFGIMLGRTICGFLCPFRFLRELLYKIPPPKIKKNRFAMVLSKARYAVLAVFVIVLLVALEAATGVPIPTFCKYTCSTGTLEGGTPLVLPDESLGSLIGALFSWKVLVLVVILLNACSLYRSPCRLLYPLGAVYSLFTPVALLGMKVDHNARTDCKLCVHIRKMGVRHTGDMECIQHEKCIRGYGVDTIHWKKPFGR